jgi:polyferredoxin
LTGVDIRHGIQLGCVQCALCIDACDNVMREIGRPAGLIGNDTDINMQCRTAANAPPPGADEQAPATISWRAIGRHHLPRHPAARGRMLNETLILPLELNRRPNGIFQSLR